jgi:hypothetical protein
MLKCKAKANYQLEEYQICAGAEKNTDSCKVKIKIK